MYKPLITTVRNVFKFKETCGKLMNFLSIGAKLPRVQNSIPLSLREKSRTKYTLISNDFRHKFILSLKFPQVKIISI